MHVQRNTDNRTNEYAGISLLSDDPNTADVRAVARYCHALHMAEMARDAATRVSDEALADARYGNPDPACFERLRVATYRRNVAVSQWYDLVKDRREAA